MSLAERLLAAGADLIDKKGEEAIDAVIEEGRGLLNDTSLLSAEERDEGGQVLDRIAENKAPFVRLGSVGFARLVAHWANGDEAAARRHYLEHEATYAERRAAIQAAGDKLADTRDAEIAAWEEVKAVLKAAGTAGISFLVKVAARVVGLPI